VFVAGVLLAIVRFFLRELGSCLVSVCLGFRLLLGFW
jgi:hypothetical protein